MYQDSTFSAIELADNKKPFQTLFYAALQDVNLTSLQNKIRFLAGLVDHLEEIDNQADNEHNTNYYLSLASSVSSTIVFVLLSSVNPVLGFASLAGTIIAVRGTWLKKTKEQPVIDTFTRYKICLKSHPYDGWAVLWQIAGDELFLEALKQGTTGEILSNSQLVRNTRDTSFTSVLKHLAAVLRVTPKTLETEARAIKAGKQSTLLPVFVESTIVSQAQTVVQQDTPTVIQSSIPTSTPISTPSAINIPLELAKSLELALIVGTPGAGKGIFVSNALDAVKRVNQNVTVFYLDPKKEPKEDGYFTGNRIDYAFRLDMFAEPLELYKWLWRAIKDYEEFNGEVVKLLVVDELKFTLEKLSQISTAEVKELKTSDKEFITMNESPVKWFSGKLSAYGSSGDSRGIVVWCINQTAHAIPGFDGGSRSMFVPVFIVSATNIAALQGLLAAKMISNESKPTTEEIKELCNRSPVGRAIYYGGTDQWYPMPRMENYSGYDRDTRTFLQTNQPTQIQPETINESADKISKKDAIAKLKNSYESKQDVALSPVAQRLLTFFGSARNKTPKTLRDMEKVDDLRSHGTYKLIKALSELVQAEKLIFDSDNEAWSKSDW